MFIGLSIAILLWLSLLLLNRYTQTPSYVDSQTSTYIGLPYNIKSIGQKSVLRYCLLVTIIIYYIVLYWYYITLGGDMWTYQLLENIYNISLGIDSISLYLVLLVGVLLPICILSGWYNTWNNALVYNIYTIALGILLLINFLCVDLLSFYIFFESTLIPLFLLIGIYGSANRDKAAYYVLLYTLWGSLYMLISIVITTYLLGSTNYIVNSNIILSIDIQLLLWLGTFIAIMVKTPLWPVHIWLPVVHSESPLSGSILLAGLVLKLALYLIIRWLLPILPEANILFTPLILILCIISIIYVSMITIVQIDLKVIIAYSSISHMAVTLLGAYSNTIIGISGSYILAIGHGLVSPGLFICVGGILYDRYHTRIIYYYNELLTYMPVFSLYLLLLSFANIGTPLSINFIGEFLSLYGAFTLHPVIITIAAFSILLSATYQMRLTNRITSGINTYIGYTPHSDVTPIENITMIALLIPVLLLGIYPNLMIDNIYNILTQYLYIL
jgi:NADH-ubiquinone oxidoreductase chain 4